MRDEQAVLHSPDTRYLIPLNREISKKLKGSGQDLAYQSGLFPVYRLQKVDPNQSDGPSWKLVLLDESKHVILTPTDHVPYSYAILVRPHGYELILGRGSHSVLTQFAEGVAAAGDVYFKNGIITKLSDQSGSYNTKEEEPQRASQIKAAAESAMQAVGLPVDDEHFKRFKDNVSPLLFRFPGNRANTTGEQNGTEIQQTRRPVLTF